MQLRVERLSQDLESALRPVYLICGDEPLQKTESLDAITASARSKGYEHQSLFVEARFDWQEASARVQNLSMFTSQQLTVLYFNKAPDKTAAKYLCDFCKENSAEHVLVIHCPKLDSGAKKSQWYQQVDQQGAIITAYPVNHRDLPKWIGNRAGTMGLKLNPEEIRMIAYRTEGNLLAAQQTLQRLQLVAKEGEAIPSDAVSSLSADMGHYQNYDVVDSALAGQPMECIRRIEQLKKQGVQVLAILNPLLREMRILSAAFDEVGRGKSLNAALQSRGVWRNRMPLMQSAYKRHSVNSLHSLLRFAYRVDLAAKGVGGYCPWHLLGRLTLRVAGLRVNA